MLSLSVYAQVVIAVSILIVWVIRFENIVSEFKHYQLSNQVRNLVGATKIILSTLLIVGIWYPDLVVIPALMMAFLMVVAQAIHFKVHNPWIKHVPSFFLLLLCLFVAGVHSGMIA